MQKEKTRSKEKRKKVSFTLDAPQMNEVFLMGDFNEWNMKKHPMKMGKQGKWEKIVYLQPGRYEYKFLADGVWRLDPNNFLTCTNSFGTDNNIILVSK